MELNLRFVESNVVYVPNEHYVLFYFVATDATCREIRGFVASFIDHQLEEMHTELLY